jgi:hypothetical protein
VTSVPPPVTRSPAPALTLRPTSGYSGDRVQVDGRRLPCTNRAGPVNLSWDDGTNLTDASLDQSGNFATSVLVTPKTDGGRLTMRARCADGVVLAADFTVLSSSPLPPERNYWWVLWLIVGIAALVYFLRRLRPSKPKPKPALPHIYAVAHPDGVPVVSVRATPKRGESTHNLRLEAHADLGTQTVREVDDDHTHAR